MQPPGQTSPTSPLPPQPTYLESLLFNVVDWFIQTKNFFNPVYVGGQICPSSMTKFQKDQFKQGQDNFWAPGQHLISKPLFLKAIDNRRQ